jgi:hypothetical protein
VVPSQTSQEYLDAAYHSVRPRHAFWVLGSIPRITRRKSWALCNLYDNSYPLNIFLRK